MWILKKFLRSFRARLYLRLFNLAIVLKYLRLFHITTVLKHLQLFYLAIVHVLENLTCLHFTQVFPIPN